MTPLQLQKWSVWFHEFRAPCGSVAMADLKASNESRSVSLFVDDDDDDERVK